MNIFPNISRTMYKISRPHSILIHHLFSYGVIENGGLQKTKWNGLISRGLGMSRFHEKVNFFFCLFFPDVCPLLDHFVVIWKGKMEEKCAIAKDVTEVSCRYSKVAIIFMFPLFSSVTSLLLQCTANRQYPNGISKQCSGRLCSPYCC